MVQTTGVIGGVCPPQIRLGPPQKRQKHQAGGVETFICLTCDCKHNYIFPMVKPKRLS